MEAGVAHTSYVRAKITEREEDFIISLELNNQLKRTRTQASMSLSQPPPHVHLPQAEKEEGKVGSGDDVRRARHLRQPRACACVVFVPGRRRQEERASQDVILSCAFCVNCARARACAVVEWSLRSGIRRKKNTG